MSFYEYDAQDNLWITDGDSDAVLIKKGQLREFFDQIEAARDEAFPPGPLEIPDPARHEELFRRINANAEEPFDADELRAAIGRLNAVAGGLIAGGRVLS